MRISTSELSAMFPVLSAKINSREWADTITKKNNGTEYGPLLREGLPMLEKLAGLKEFPAALIQRAESLSVRGNPLTRLAMSMCGRGEHGHNVGISVNKTLIGVDAKASCKAVAMQGATATLKLLKSEIQKLEKKPAPRTTRRKVAAKVANK